MSRVYEVLGVQSIIKQTERFQSRRGMKSSLKGTRGSNEAAVACRNEPVVVLRCHVDEKAEMTGRWRLVSSV